MHVGYFFMSLSSADIFSKLFFFKNVFLELYLSVSNGLDPDQARHFPRKTFQPAHEILVLIASEIVQMSMHICTVLLEPSLLSYIVVN